MKSQAKQQGCDITIGVDHGSLRLQFPARHKPLWELLDGKQLGNKPKYLPLGKHGYKDNPDDWRRATTLAIQLEADLDHPEWEKLFDPTLAKYGIGSAKYSKLADVLQLPGTVAALPEITVGAMWAAYLEWKKTVVEETTFKSHFIGIFSRAIKGLVWDASCRGESQVNTDLTLLTCDSKVAIQAGINLITISRKPYLLTELSRAFDFCKSKGLIVNSSTENPFDTGKFHAPAVTTQQKYASKVVGGVEKQWHEVQDEKALEGDRRAFTKDERDIIIKAFYESDKLSEKQLAPLIEFYFLTGCRTSEAIPLSWADVDFDRNIIRFSKSMGVQTGKVKSTKTGETRIFYFSETSRLKKLLLELKASSNSSLIFTNEKGKYLTKSIIATAWRGDRSNKTLKDGTEKKYYYPGLVTRLVSQGIISAYLSQYHTRHTYITVTAQANKHDNNALLCIATACGNSVDVILRHYLGMTEATHLIEV